MIDLTSLHNFRERAMKGRAACLSFSDRGHYKSLAYLYILNIFNFINTVLKEEGNEQAGFSEFGF